MLTILGKYLHYAILNLIFLNTSKTPLRKWAYFYGIGKIALDMIGFPIFNDDQRLQSKSYMGHVFFITIFITSGYTIVYYLWFQGNTLAGLPSTCILAGPVVAVSSIIEHFFIALNFIEITLKFMMIFLEFAVSVLSNVTKTI